MEGKLYFLVTCHLPRTSMTFAIPDSPLIPVYAHYPVIEIHFHLGAELRRIRPTRLTRVPQLPSRRFARGSKSYTDETATRRDDAREGGSA